MTELKERARKQREELEKRMMGDGSDDDGDGDKEDQDGEQDGGGGRKKASNDDSGCSWGMGEPLLLSGRGVVLNTAAVIPSELVQFSCKG